MNAPTTLAHYQAMVRDAVAQQQPKPKRDPLLLDGHMFYGIALDVHGTPDDGDGCEITAIYAAGDDTDLFELIDAIPRGLHLIETACDRQAVKEQKASKFDSKICDLEYAK